MPDEVPIELGFAVAVETDRVVKIDATLVRHQLVKVSSELVWAGHIHSEIRARVGEQHSQVAVTVQDRIQRNSLFARMPKT